MSLCPGASGNVATEDVLYLLEGLGLVTGVSLEKNSCCRVVYCREAGQASTVTDRPCNEEKELGCQLHQELNRP